jgi:Dyp-type peroxidase family
MSVELQEGIYYRASPPIGNSFCILSLGSDNVYHIREIGNTVGLIWKHLQHLKNGITVDLNIDKKHRKIGNLTVLVAYGSGLFSISGSQKKRPAGFADNWNFKAPKAGGGGPILQGSGINYSKNSLGNHLLSDDIVFQFIADTEFYTNRAVIEVWKVLRRLEKNKQGAPLRINGFYTGFQRADRRSWLGFHDGVSNIKSHERTRVISIDSRYLNPVDRWTLKGTYLAFMRIAFNIEKWEDTSVTEQELLIGRDKLTGCPVVGVDNKGKPLKDNRCPVPGTSEVIEPGNEHFRQQPPYWTMSQNKILQYSHIARTNPIERIPIWDTKSMRIYRQGFEFLVPSTDNTSLTPGLNFVSFQNTPERLFRALTYERTIVQKNLGTSVPNLDRYMSVLAAGIFFVPPKISTEPFPGAGIFFNNTDLMKFSRTVWKKSEGQIYGEI